MSKVKRTFKNIAKLVHSSRHKAGLSQNFVSKTLGYGNGQVISNIERGNASVPINRMKDFCSILSIKTTDMKRAILKDTESTISSILK